MCKSCDTENADECPVCKQSVSPQDDKCIVCDRRVHCRRKGGRCSSGGPGLRKCNLCNVKGKRARESSSDQGVAPPLSTAPPPPSKPQTLKTPSPTSGVPDVEPPKQASDPSALPPKPGVNKPSAQVQSPPGIKAQLPVPVPAPVAPNAANSKKPVKTKRDINNWAGEVDEARYERDDDRAEAQDDPYDGSDTDDVASEADVPTGKKGVRYVRPADRRMKAEGFPQGSLGLRRVAISQEAIQAYQDPVVRSLVGLTTFQLPTAVEVREGLTLQQRKAHIYTLDSLLDIMVEKSFPTYLSLVDSLLEALKRMKAARQWGSPATPGTTAATLAGCMKRLDQYTGLPPVALEHHSAWRDAITYYNKLSLGFHPDRFELTPEQLQKMLKSASPKVSALLLLNWFHAARIRNALDLKRGESTFTPVSANPQAGYQWAITWYRAKTSGKVGPYTTHSWISQEHYQKWESLFSQMGSNDFLFTNSKKERDALYLELKSLLPKGYDLRALRRGALCALAREGTPLDTVAVFSGHTTVRMLLRYLRHGRAAGARQQEGAAAARSALALPQC